MSWVIVGVFGVVGAFAGAIYWLAKMMKQIGKGG